MSENATETTTYDNDPYMAQVLAEAESLFPADPADLEDGEASPDGEGDVAPEGEQEPEVESEEGQAEPEKADAAPEKPAEGAKDEAKPRNQLRDLDAEFAKARRWQQDLARKEQEIDQLREQGLKELQEARQLLTLFRDNPVKAHELAAQNMGLSPADYLRVLQQRIVNDDQPTESEIVRELREVKQTLKAREEDERKRAEESTKAQRMQQLTAVKNQQVDTLLTDLRGHADKFPHLAALLEADEQGVMGQFQGAIEYIFENRLTPGTLEVLAQLDEIEAQNVQRYGSVYNKLGVRGAAPAGTPDTSQSNGQANPAQGASKAKTGKPRTVHSTDLASNSSARREKTEAEIMAEAEAIFK